MWVNVSAVVDSDGDGLDDSWEQDHFGDLDETANGDPDGDGFTNLQEFENGTDPTVSNLADVPAEFPWWILLVLLIVIMVIFILFLLMKRRRSEEEEFLEDEQEGEEEIDSDAETEETGSEDEEYEESTHEESEEIGDEERD